MEFGVQFFPNVGPDEKSAAVYYDESLSIAEEAETLGYTHARVVEHYFHPYGGYSPNPMMFLSALSRITKTLRLVTGAILPVFSHPLKQAAEIAMLDGLSHGRLDVGFARAFLPHEFRRFGISVDESNARFREGIEQIDLLLTQENVSHDGEFHKIVSTTSLPRPTTQPRPKFYIAATQTEESFEFAGRMGHSLMAIPISSKMKDLLKIYRQAWRDAGHEGDGEVMIAFHMFCHEDSARAIELARPSFDQYFRSIIEVTKDWVDGPPSSNYKNYGESMSKMSKVTLETQIESGAAWVGSPQEIRNSIDRIVDTIGPFEHASMQINFGMVDIEEARSSMRLFAKEIIR